MWHGDWLFRDTLISKVRRLKHRLMLKWGPECLSPAFLKKGLNCYIKGEMR